MNYQPQGFRSQTARAMCIFLMGLGFAASGCNEPATAADGGTPPWDPPAYDGEFVATWHDGLAEMASYDLTYPRYGERRAGTAAIVTVTEPFNPRKRVKADAVGEDTYNVVKLNLSEDFQTGVYDYNLMTSAFVATSAVNGLPAGSATKVSFSAQEWCGQVYQQALFSGAKRGTPGVRTNWHSYFENAADDAEQLDHPAGGVAEDALILWARGLAGPRLEPGQSVTVPVFRSLAVQRLEHVAPAWEEGTLSRDAQSARTDQTEDGVSRIDLFRADVAGRQYEFGIDATPGSDRTLLWLKRSDGYELKLRGVDRMPYWNMKAVADEAALEEMGLRRRGPGAM
jgi:hypothetical protein